MEVQINERFVKAKDGLRLGNTTLLITPPLDGDYWMMRVPLSDTQAIVCFPKFGTIGVGFQREEDWNTNLPYTCSAEEIFEHIAHNKGDESILDAACVEAIKALQAAVKEYRNESLALNQ
jgi:hypothetical protein